MSGSELLLRELRAARRARRGCTHRELSAAGVAWISRRVEALRERGYVIHEERLPASGVKVWKLLYEPALRRQAGRPAPAPGAPTLFEPPPRAPRSPYDVERG